jgi:hypothetical protein
MFTTIKLIDSLFGLILANVAVGVPFATWMMKGFFDTLPRRARAGRGDRRLLAAASAVVRDPAAREAGSGGVRDLPGDRRVERVRVRADAGHSAGNGSLPSAYRVSSASTSSTGQR